MYKCPKCVFKRKAKSEIKAHLMNEHRASNSQAGDLIKDLVFDADDDAGYVAPSTHKLHHEYDTKTPDDDCGSSSTSHSSTHHGGSSSHHHDSGSSHHSSSSHHDTSSHSSSYDHGSSGGHDSGGGGGDTSGGW